MRGEGVGGVLGGVEADHGAHAALAQSVAAEGGTEVAAEKAAVMVLDAGGRQAIPIAVLFCYRESEDRELKML